MFLVLIVLLKNQFIKYSIILFCSHLFSQYNKNQFHLKTQLYQTDPYKMISHVNQPIQSAFGSTVAVDKRIVETKKLIDYHLSKHSVCNDQSMLVLEM